MEPELAFLMANLAQVRGGAAVLDPCCGSGGLVRDGINKWDRTLKPIATALQQPAHDPPTL